MDYGDNLQLYARFDSPAGPGIANQYDGFGRLATTTADTDGTSRTLAYKYDAASLRARITHPDQAWFEYDRDTLGRPFWLDSADPAGGCYYSAYFADGLPGSQSRCNSASTWVSRDGLGRLNGLGHYYGQGGAGDVLWLYDFNPASQIRSVSRDNDAYAWTGHYAVNRAYTTNGLNQYTAAGSASFGYDANGNLVSDGSKTYVYDVENRLVSASNGAALAYDPLGRLYQITATDGTVTRFLYDGDALVAEYDGNGVMTRRYVHWDGADVPIISYTGNTLTAPSYLHADHQGSIIAISSPSGVTQINRYDEYGIPGASNVGRFQYTGQIWLAELGMYYYKSRIYSPTFGRFLQTDPVGYADQYNLYAYVGNDPINHADPSGTCRDRDQDSECIVKNEAGVAGVRAQGLLQAQVRDIDHRIQALDPNTTIPVRDNDGNVIGNITGRDLRHEWDQTSWRVRPVGEHIGASGEGGGISSMGIVRITADRIESAALWGERAGAGGAAGVRTVALHEVTHNTSFGRGLTREFPTGSNRLGSMGYDLRETRTSMGARSIARELGMEFVCTVFGNGCGE